MAQFPQGQLFLKGRVSIAETYIAASKSDDGVPASNMLRHGQVRGREDYYFSDTKDSDQ